MTTERSNDRAAAIIRDKALSFFRANPDVRLACSSYGVDYVAGRPRLRHGPCHQACALTPMLLDITADNIDCGIIKLAGSLGVSVNFLINIASGWDMEHSADGMDENGQPYAPEVIRAWAIGHALRKEVERERRVV